SVSDYMMAAIPRRLGVYMAYTLGCVALQVFRIGKYGAYWQYIAIGSFAALELSMMTSQTDPAIVRALLELVPHRTSFELAQIMQQAMLCFFIALNQIGPQFIPQERNVSSLELAKELLAGMQTTNAEVSGKAKRLADMFSGTGLERHMVDEFKNELQLGMTLGSSPKFRDLYVEKLNASRQNLSE
ncbi:hypothetical protein GGI02_005499, partial [Coemansia sp. RSA 2322]